MSGYELRRLYPLHPEMEITCTTRKVSVSFNFRQMTLVFFSSFILLACERLSDWFRGYSIVLVYNIALLKKRKELKENKKNDFLLIFSYLL